MRKIIAVIVASLMMTTLVSGQVFAKSGIVEDKSNQGIVGMWVEVEGGRSGWAKLTGGEGGTSYYSFWEYDTQGKRFKVDIGYNGTPAQWGKTIHSNWIDTDFEHVDFTIRPKMFLIPIWAYDELIIKYR
jgi:hypothetical protein